MACSHANLMARHDRSRHTASSISFCKFFSSALKLVDLIAIPSGHGVHSPQI